MVVVRSFDELQAGLGQVLGLHRDGGRSEHVVVVLPSLSLGSSVEGYYDTLLPRLEHRFLLGLTMLGRLPGCEVIVVLAVAPDPGVWDYYLDLAAPTDRGDVARRAHLVTVDDPSGRSLSAKLLDRGDLLDQVRDLIGGRPGFIDAYTVTGAEVEVAVRLQLPINGPVPGLARLGYKSAGRRVLAEAGVPVPTGREDLRTVEQVLDAARAIQADHPEVPSVVVKLDNYVSGLGNTLLHLPAANDPGAAQQLRAQLGGLPSWYLADLRHGAVVEEHIAGDRLASPSVQATIDPDGQVHILGTHEQELAGPHGHTFHGARFPADPAYAARLARHTHAVGQVLARRGVIGAFSVDFVVTWHPDRGWSLFALEINLRQGGTTPPLGLLANLDPGQYLPDPGRWHSAAGGVRCYRSTDNLTDPRWVGLTPGQVIDAMRDAGLGWDHHRRTGVVLHLLSCLAVDGRIGLTAIAPTPHQADTLSEAAVTVLDDLAAATTPR